MFYTVSVSSLMAISIGLLFLINAIQQVALAQDNNITNVTGTKDFQTEMNVNIPKEYFGGIIGALGAFSATLVGAIVKYYHDMRLKDIELKKAHKNALALKVIDLNNILEREREAHKNALALKVIEHSNNLQVEMVRIREDLTSKYDIDLRNKRIEAYTKLWEYLKPLSFFTSKEKYTYNELEEFSEELTK